MHTPWGTLYSTFKVIDSSHYTIILIILFNFKIDDLPPIHKKTDKNLSAYHFPPDTILSSPFPFKVKLHKEFHVLSIRTPLQGGFSSSLLTNRPRVTESRMFPSPHLTRCYWPLPPLTTLYSFASETSFCLASLPPHCPCFVFSDISSAFPQVRNSAVPQVLSKILNYTYSVTSLYKNVPFLQLSLPSTQFTISSLSPDFHRSLNQYIQPAYLTSPLWGLNDTSFSRFLKPN